MSFNAVFLDYATLDHGDLNFQSLHNHFGHLQLYPETFATQVIERLKNVDVAITNKVVLDAKMIQQLPQLKLILVAATGTNNVDLEAAKAQGIVVCNCQGYGTHSVAQHTLALMLALATNLVKYDQAVKQGRWQKSEQFCFLDYPIVELSGKTLGIIGYGELGHAVAQLAKAFGMQVILGQIPNRPAKADHLPLDEFLPQLDVLSLHCPLTDETRNLIDEAQINLMKPSAFIVNVARGGIINEQVLADALKKGRIAGAATDVLSVEPPKDGNVLLNSDVPNLIITPHSAWGSVQARQRIVDQLVENVVAFQQDKLIRQVNI
ncbi:2-hydroxyacid dehydrogenase [Acinetobacter puyangensis]|uniref:2-hydroxyacid dehydrogenase n=1 Tax=Acinetobacter puyangensis TaxID=1096779 RepID=UPI003A4E0BB5